MTQQAAPAVANKTLLYVALALGAVVAVIYNVHIAQVRRAAQGSSVRLVRVTEDLRAERAQVEADYWVCA